MTTKPTTKHSSSPGNTTPHCEAEKLTLSETIRRKITVKKVLEKNPKAWVEFLRGAHGRPVSKKVGNRKGLLELGITFLDGKVYRISDRCAQLVSEVIEPVEILNWRRISTALDSLRKEMLFEEDAVVFFSERTGMSEENSRNFLKYEGLYESWKDCPLYPEAPGLDDETRARRRILRTQATRLK